MRDASASSNPNTQRLLDAIAPFKDRISLRSLDLSDLAAVHSFARSLAGEITAGSIPPLSSIICNAFYWNLTTSALELTRDGLEKTFQVNHLAHAALVLRLLGSCTPRARIVLFASDAIFPGKNGLEKYPPSLPAVGMKDDGDDLSKFDSLVRPANNAGDGDGDGDAGDPLGHGFQRYANSKLAAVAWMYALNRRLQRKRTAEEPAGQGGITAIAVNPGNLSDSRALRVNTPLSVRVMSRVIVKPLSGLLRAFVDPTMRTAKDAGVDVIELAVGEEHANAEGYFTLRKQDESSAESRDERKQEALWVKTLEWLGMGEGDTIVPV